MTNIRIYLVRLLDFKKYKISLGHSGDTTEPLITERKSDCFSYFGNSTLCQKMKYHFFKCSRKKKSKPK